MWSKTEINNHVKAAQILDGIKDAAFVYMREHRDDVTEWQVKDFILAQFRKYQLQSAIGLPIVAFGESAAQPHHIPRHDARLAEGMLVKLDIWARLRKPHAPFADITWMAYCGTRVPKKGRKVYDTVIRARDAAVEFLKKELRTGRIPTGKAVDDAATRVLVRVGFKKYIKHRTGHSIGFQSPHGEYPNVNQTNKEPLEPNLGYTIEPGVYIDGEFGVRSEIDFYITEKKKLLVTTKVQNKFIII